MAKNAKDTAGKGKNVTPCGEETKQNANTERAGKLYDDKGKKYRFASSKSHRWKLLYYYNGVGGHYLPVAQLDNFVLDVLR